MTEPTKISHNGSVEARTEVQDAFNAWSSLLTTHSVQMSYAIIAANWAAHFGTDGILKNTWSKWSMILALGFLALNLLTNGLMALEHYLRFLYAEKNPERWKKEYEESRGERFWPYTKRIEYLGLGMRCVKTLVPLLSAISFILSLFYN